MAELEHENRFFCVLNLNFRSDFFIGTDKPLESKIFLTNFAHKKLTIESRHFYLFCHIIIR